jgi:hypothetical protein
LRFVSNRRQIWRFLHFHFVDWGVDGGIIEAIQAGVNSWGLIRIKRWERGNIRERVKGSRWG